MPRPTSVNPMTFRLVVQPPGLKLSRGWPRQPAAGSPAGGSPARGSRAPLLPRFVQNCCGVGLAAATLLLGASLAVPAPAGAASALLETVKQNPQLAKQLCAEFKQLNAEGRSATSPESLARVASSQSLSTMDAEVLTTYVIGLYCPDVR